MFGCLEYSRNNLYKIIKQYFITNPVKRKRVLNILHTFLNLWQGILLVELLFKIIFMSYSTKFEEEFKTC